MTLTVHGHLVDLGGVVLLNVAQDADVVVLHKVDGDAFPAIPARAADSAEARGKREWSHCGKRSPSPRALWEAYLWINPCSPSDKSLFKGCVFLRDTEDMSLKANTTPVTLNTIHKYNKYQDFLTKHPAWSASYNMLPIIQFADILAHIGAPNAGVALYVHVVSQGQKPLD
ncbi:hypothetical protein IHE44_0008857 [Lamprotornis superbus]|uniref:Uncharacterized protein n=1 Tax=Lamprotornis superbus TaxID=245042 RepID=A0A835TRA0_9PASS|nr:hypothetical protein IHE44_0008857 [Lamprotornis superbus]